MSNRFGRDTSRSSNSLFTSSPYNRSPSPSKTKSKSPSYASYAFPSSSSPSYPSTSHPPASTPENLFPSNPGVGPAFAAYPGAGNGSAAGGAAAGFRTATPNSRGQYSDAVLSELESQNDDEIGVLTGKVKMLKDITLAIGTEIRESTSLAEKMNDSFDNTRVRLRGTMNRMLRMAEKTGVGWRVWLMFFFVVGVLFWYVWLF